MKHILPVLAILAFSLFCLPPEAQAQNAPNIKESINTFMHYFNETVVQSLQVQEILKEEGLSDADTLFFFDLTSRLDKTLGFVMNLRDLYFLYGKTTYCFTKDERKYILDRIDNISGALKTIAENTYFLDASDAQEAPDKRRAENMTRFKDRVDRLRAFIETSLHIFR
ncbi:hypothetical protein [Desulfolutivibrio sulfoxidireducens]|uniref:hypothetical protein n=1 Tax=Desulfolutivibrio sulfoxidireducens TaxID=2773299 RepID=UPI00159D3440|nr:hypothetical protein [Desulfolutivibrio sulfoxidireducens]QLA21518.1 hypothetical protein GD604_18160 [Desulfolutivibrio sulfoxidireducens]